MIKEDTRFAYFKAKLYNAQAKLIPESRKL